MDERKTTIYEEHLSTQSEFATTQSKNKPRAHQFFSSVGPVWDVKFSGDRVISCGQDFTIRIWDTWTTQCISTILGHRNSICSIALRISLSKPSGAANSPHDLLVSGSRDCSVKVWDLNSLLLAPYQPPTSSSCLVTFHGHTACVNCVAVDSNLVASASDDCSVRVWDLTTVWCNTFFKISVLRGCYYNNCLADYFGRLSKVILLN